MQTYTYLSVCSFWFYYKKQNKTFYSNAQFTEICLYVLFTLDFKNIFTAYEIYWQKTMTSEQADRAS